ncbi:MAG: c-type cytochrome [Oculatellaceae cyanobacterium Prado106]|jgi:cytochrome c peroxidase|nr:c-type cytochrome [Oculatellaceae cyanobacterium Prado106]
MKWLNLAIAFALSCCLALGWSRAIAHPTSVPLAPSHSAPADSAYPWNLPAWVPRPVVPADNPMTVAKVELGRHLFYETRLSVTGKFSCASCHEQALAFTDGKPVAIGATDEPHPRNSMSLTNIAYTPVLTWANPLMTRLEQQALVPLFGEHPVEMGMAGREDQILEWLQTDPAYRQMFVDAFGESNADGSSSSSSSISSSSINSSSINSSSINSSSINSSSINSSSINISNLMKAIASFERTLLSFNSPYDRYRYNRDTTAISAAAKRGETLFNSERLECFHCHGGINFSDSIQHERLAFQEIAFHNTGLYNLDGQGAYPPNNTGLYEITDNPSDMGRFRAPTLRNIALTAPYMHDGSIATLEDAIAHYQAGGRTLPSGPYAGNGSTNPLKSPFISGFPLSPSERQDLIEFLQSLTDESFTTHPAFSNPHQGGVP